MPIQGAALKCSEVMSQVGGKKNLKNQEVEKEPKKKGGLGVDLPSDFRVLRVMCLCFFAQAS